MSAEAPAPPDREERLHRLREERDFLLASLADLEREHAAGDVDAGDYASLRGDYVGRAAEALRELARLEETEGRAGANHPSGPGEGEDGEGAAWSVLGQAASSWEAGRLARLRRFLGRRGTRRVLGAVGLCCALGIVGIAAAHFAGVRLPGESATGTISLPTTTQVRQDLSQASELGSAGEVSQAVDLYDQVLQAVPHQPEALAYRGWLVRLSGIASHSRSVVTEGDEQLAEVAEVAPGYPDGRAFYGIALLEDQGKLGPALAQFRACLADRPSADLLEAVGPKMAAAYAQAHEAVPTRLRRYSGVKAGS